MLYQTIGYLAAFFITISFIPQVIKSYKTKKVEDVSIGLIITTLIGTVLWWFYGLILKDGPLLVYNTILGIVVICQLRLKIKYGRNKLS
ncbi:MAG: SemiSWEET family transporter [Patescibacteria group bacterium]|jgi:MtN3 and saliva related transmembrane protein